ncbi:hypothetical protein OKW31_003467 [Paraburkholderia atlantica]
MLGGLGGIRNHNRISPADCESAVQLYRAGMLFQPAAGTERRTHLGVDPLFRNYALLASQFVPARTRQPVRNEANDVSWVKFS